MSDIDKMMKTVSNRMSAVKGDSGTNELVYGKVQPQAIPLEEAVLGAIMLRQRRITHCN